MDGLLALYIYLLTGLARFARPLSVIGFGEYREWHPGEKLKVPCTRLESADHNAALMTGVLRQLSLLATSRYHAAVLSMDRAIPIAAVSMDERLDSLMEECGLHKHYLLHTTDADLGRKLYAVIKAADADRDAIRESILRQTSFYREQLDKMGQFLKAFVKDKFGECP